MFSKEQGNALAVELGGARIKHYETSAKNNINFIEVGYRKFHLQIHGFNVKS